MTHAAPVGVIARLEAHRAPSTVLQSLQVYRGLAALMVVLYHITDLSAARYNYRVLNGAFRFGYTGVDFFFVLSGFIIAYTNRSDIGERAALGPYFRKRFVRVYPLYWLIAGTKLALIGANLIPGGPHEREPATILASLLLLPQSHPPVIGVAWTLIYEVLFYLIFAAIIRWGWTCAVSLVAVWLMLIGINAAGLLDLDSPILQVLSNERNLEFLLGVTGTVVVLRYRLSAPYVWVLAGAGLYAIAAWSVNSGYFVSSYTLWFGVPSLLLVIGGASLDLAGGRWPSWLVFVGGASYSIYLMHTMFIDGFLLVVLRLIPFGVVVSVAAVACAVIGGCLIHVAVERPLLALLKPRWRTGRRGVLVAQT
jgi:exopolysaccharide production protein ExoZ